MTEPTLAQTSDGPSGSGPKPPATAEQKSENGPDDNIAQATLVGIIYSLEVFGLF